MATEVIALQLTTDTKQAEQSVGNFKKQLKDATSELVNMSMKFGETSTQAAEAAKKVAKLKDSIGDAKALADTFNPDKKFVALGGALQGVTAGFSAFSGAMGVLGADSKETEKLLLKVQSAMALQQGISGIMGAVDSFKLLASGAMKYTVVQKIVTAAQWLWNAAMAANPIGALVVVIAAVIAGIVALTMWFMKSAEASKENTKAINENKKALEEQIKARDKATEAGKQAMSQELAMAKATGGSTNAIRALELKLIDKRIADEKGAYAAAQHTLEINKQAYYALKAADANESILKKSFENFTNSVKELNAQNVVVKNVLDERTQIVKKHEVEVATERTTARNKNIADNKTANDKLKEEENIAKQKRLDLQAQFKVDNQKAKKDENEQDATDRADKLKLLDKNNLEDIGKKMKNAQESTEIKQNTANAQIEIDKKLADDEIELEAKKTAAKHKALDDLQTIFGTETAMGKAILLAKQAMAIQEMVMSIKSTLFHAKDTATKATISAAGAGVDIAKGSAKTASALPFPANIPLIIGYAAQAFGIITAIRSALKQVKGAGASSNLSTASSSAAVAAPIIAEAQTTRLDQSTINAVGNAAGRAYVLESDVSNNQERIRRLNRAARIN